MLPGHQQDQFKNKGLKACMPCSDLPDCLYDDQLKACNCYMLQGLASTPLEEPARLTEGLGPTDGPFTARLYHMMSFQLCNRSVTDDSWHVPHSVGATQLDVHAMHDALYTTDKYYCYCYLSGFGI